MQCNMGAKNHGVIMPDANKEYTINQVSNCPPNISACWRRLRCCRSALHGPVDRSAGGGGQVLVARGEKPLHNHNHNHNWGRPSPSCRR